MVNLYEYFPTEGNERYYARVTTVEGKVYVSHIMYDPPDEDDESHPDQATITLEEHSLYLYEDELESIEILKKYEWDNSIRRWRLVRSD